MGAPIFVFHFRELVRHKAPGAAGGGDGSGSISVVSL
jgi:hypothetical protein